MSKRSSYNMSLVVEEISSIYSIYGKDVTIEGHNSISVRINDNLKLFLVIPKDYPTMTAPEYTLFAPMLSSKIKKKVGIKFNEIAEHYKGCPIIFTWVEALRELAETANKGRRSKASARSSDRSVVAGPSQNIFKKFYVFTGRIISDKRSTFQGHCCGVSSPEEAKLVLSQLLEVRKIAQARHNIMGYRIRMQNGMIIEAVDEDGETGSRPRIAALLKMTNVLNVVVIVTRWYKGSLLGNERFKHIHNAATMALKEGGFIKK